MTNFVFEAAVPKYITLTMQLLGTSGGLQGLPVLFFKRNMAMNSMCMQDKASESAGPDVHQYLHWGL